MKQQLQFIFVLFVGILLSFTSVQAQGVFPVKVQGDVLFPSTFLEDYRHPENFRVQVSLKDIQQPVYNIILKMSFESDNYSFETINGIELELIGGDVYTLGELELGELLKSSNINNTPPESGTLPEGLYTVTYTAIDARVENLTVSNPNTDFTIVPVEINGPPLLNQPENGTELNTEALGQTLMFTWLPQNFAISPTRSIKYNLRIVKVFPNDRNPYDAMATGSFIVNDNEFTDIETPVFIFDPSNFTLEEGATYAWNVEAYEEIFDDGTFKTSSARFKNNGVSQVYTFTVEEVCEEVIIEKPIIEPATEITEDLIALTWTGSINHTNYEVRYRPAGTVQPWQVVQLPSGDGITMRHELTASQLTRGTTYEYSIRAQCTGWQSYQYGGTFQLQPQNCPAPSPIYINSNDGENIVLSWDAIEEAGSYSLTYSLNDGNSQDRIELTNTSTLDGIKTGFYTIQVDAICGNLVGEGKPEKLNYNDQIVVGDCPLATPFTLLAIRNETEVEKESAATLTWPSLPIHQSYELSYWHRDSINESVHTVSVTEPTALIDHVFSDQLYNYTIKAVCKGGKEVTTPQGGFRIDGGGVGGPVITTPTADCFPPALVMGEAKDVDKARFEWSKVREAEEYQLFYYLESEGPETEQLFTSTSASGIIDKLETGLYKFKVRCRCGGEYSIFSEEASVDLSNVPENSNCDSLVSFEVNNESETEIQLGWAYPQADHDSYKIRYKSATQLWGESYILQLTNWDDLVANNLNATKDMMRYTVDKLNSGTAYNFEITAICGDDFAKNNSPITGNTTPVEDEECGSGECDRTSTEPSPALKVDDMVDVADYQMKILTIGAGTKTGTWNGTALADMPLIGMSEKVSSIITFTDLFVNVDGCVVEGDMDIQIDINLLPKELTDKIKDVEALVGSSIEKAGNIINTASGFIDKATEATSKANDYFQGGGGTGMPNTGSADVTATVKGTVEDGATIPDADISTSERPTLAKDDNNTVFSVDENNKATETGHFDDSFNGADKFPEHDDITLVFEENKEAVYFFDEYQDAYGSSPAMASHYIPNTSAKAITPGTVDLVDYKVESETKIDSEKLTFVNSEGLVLKKEGNSTLRLPGGPAKDAQIIFAVYEDAGEKKTIGKLLLASYAPKVKKIVLIPVRYSKDFKKDIAKIEEELNKTYSGVGVDCQITLDDSFKDDLSWCSTPNCSFTPDGSATLSNNYTGDEKAVMDAYIQKNLDRLDPDAAYLFAVGSAVASEEQGKMNFGEQFGFLYAVTSVKEKDLGRTLAHELGHGNYKLYHSFENMYLGKDTKGKTENIMDYASGHHLNKLQWDLVDEPGVTWGIFSKDKDQKVVKVTDWSKLEKFEKDGWLTFMSPAGIPISLEFSKINSLVFASSEDDFGDRFYPIGSLVAFDYDGKHYNPYRLGSGSSTRFVGYKTVIDGIPVTYEESFSEKKAYENILGGLPCMESYQFIFKVFPLRYDHKPSILSVNKAEGALKSEFYLKNLFGNEEEAEKVYVSFLDGEDEDKASFLLKYAGAELCGKESLFAFKVVDLINSNPQYFECLDNVLRNVESEIEGLASDNVWDKTKQEYVSVSTSVHSEQRISANNEEYLKLYNNTLAELKAEGMMEFYYKELKNYLSILNPKEGQIASLDKKSIDEVLAFVKIQSDEIRWCLLESLPYDKRIAIISRANEWHISTFGYKEDLLVDLLQSTPSSELKLLYNDLKEDDYAIYWDLYGDINYDETYDRLISVVTSLVYEMKQVGEITSLVTPTISAANTYSRPQHMMIYKEATKREGDYNLYYKTTQERKNHQIFISTLFANRYKLENQVSIYTTSCTNTPFSLVKIRFGDDFQIQDPLGNKISTRVEYVVPLVWLKWFLERQSSIEDWTAFRIMLNSVAIGASVLTMEPGPMMIAEIIIGSTDIVVALNEDRIKSSGSTAEKELLGLYDEVSALLAITDVTQAVKVGVGAYKFTKTAFSSRISNLKNSVSDLTTFSAGIKNIFTKSVSTYGKEWGGYAAWASFQNSVYLEVEAYKYAKRIQNFDLTVAQADQLAVKYLSSGGQVISTGRIADVTGDIESGSFMLENVSTYNSTVHGSKSEAVLVGKMENVLTKTSTGTKLQSHSIYASKNGLFFTELLANAVDDFVEGIVNGVRRYNVAGEIADGVTTITRQISSNGNTITLKWVVDANGKISFGNRSNLATILGTIDDEAHHILTWTKSGGHPIVQAAAKDGFHLNTFENGIGLSKYRKSLGEGMHGNHPAYDDYVVHKLSEFKRDYPNFTPELANEHIQKNIIPHMKDLIEDASNSVHNLNEYFKQVVNPSVGTPLLTQ